jgi:outer membrane protein assembly factor BamB
MQHGCPLNRSAAAVTLTARGPARVSWTAPLPDREAADIVTDGEGRVFVVSGRRLLAIAGGRTLWSVDTDAAFGRPVILDDGAVAIAEVGRRLMALDPRSGDVRWASSGSWAPGRPLVTSRGSIGNAMLADEQCRSPSQETAWQSTTS